MDKEQLSTLIAIAVTIGFSFLSAYLDRRKKSAEARRARMSGASGNREPRKEAVESHSSMPFEKKAHYMFTPESEGMPCKPEIQPLESVGDVSRDSVAPSCAPGAEDLRRAVVWSEILKTKF